MGSYTLREKPQYSERDGDGPELNREPTRGNGRQLQASLRPALPPLSPVPNHPSPLCKGYATTTGPGAMILYDLGEIHSE